MPLLPARSPASRVLAAGLALGLACTAVSACGIGGKREVAKTALDAMSPDARREAFEATARILDHHPELVDELYAVVRHHPKLVDRFVQNATTDLQDGEMANVVASHLAQDPVAVETTFTVALPRIAKRPPARAAMNRALVREAELAADIVTDSPHATTRMLDATLDALERKPAARRAMLAAVHGNRRRILDFAAQDPALMGAITKDVLKELVHDKPVLERALRAAKILEP